MAKPKLESGEAAIQLDIDADSVKVSKYTVLQSEGIIKLDITLEFKSDLVYEAGVDKPPVGDTEGYVAFKKGNTTTAPTATITPRADMGGTEQTRLEIVLTGQGVKVQHGE